MEIATRGIEDPTRVMAAWGHSINLCETYHEAFVLYTQRVRPREFVDSRYVADATAAAIQVVIPECLPAALWSCECAHLVEQIKKELVEESDARTEAYNRALEEAREPEESVSSEPSPRKSVRTATETASV
jgi:hypothetical protein